MASFDFAGHITGIYGANGAGKTNLLDAVYYLCVTKSYFNKNEVANIHHGKDGLRLTASFIKNKQPLEVVCIHRNAKKELSINGIEYNRLSEHIGLLPVVIIAPDDVELITGSSEQRRKYIDAFISQLDADYLQQLMLYNKILQQRNSLLKQFAETRTFNKDLIATLDEQILNPAIAVFEKRSRYLKELIPEVLNSYGEISGFKEDVAISYISALQHQTMESLLRNNLQKDSIAQRTTEGLHRDDLELALAGQPFKTIASQGQRKSLLFALKLAEYNLLKKYKGFAPLLLLDDVFEKLDAERMHKLLKMVCLNPEAQVLITDTHMERLQEAFESLGTEYQLIGL